MTLGSKIDILLVDDKEENLLALEAVLSSPQYNLIKKSSGAEALKYLLNHDCAIILLDVQMPEMDGFETASFIKKSERSRNIPIIFITAINTDDRFVQFGYKSGAVDYLFKPFQPDILRSKVAVFAELYQSKLEIKRQGELIRDIDRKDRERALSELELRSLRREQIVQAKYRDLVDSIQHAIIWSADPVSSTFLFVSPSAELILGYPLEKWTTQNEFWGDHIHPDDLQNITLAFEKVKKYENVEIEHRLMRADGKVIWFHTGMRLERKSENLDEFELRGLSIDISQIKEAQEALRQSEERARLLAETSFLLSKTLDYEETLTEITQLVVPALADCYEIALVDAESRLVSVSFTGEVPQFDGKNKLEKPSDAEKSLLQVIEKADTEFCPTMGDFLQSQTADEAHLKRLAQQGVQSALIIPLVTRAKAWGVMTFAFKDSQRVYDLNDLKTAEDLGRRVAVAIDNARLFRDARAAVRARDEFLSIASHELKTPLTPLRLHTQLLLKALAKDGDLTQMPAEKINRMITSSDRQVQRLAQLVDDLLDISRINVGKLDLNIEKFKLSDLISEVIERFASQVQQANCQIEFEENDNVEGEWDRFRLEQVFINLLTNAIKYGPGKPIKIRVYQEGGLTRLVVADQGIGIAKEDQARIFERFERAVSSTHFGGLGLGLYIASEIVKAHGGRLLVDSVYGQGSSFTLELPHVYIPAKISNLVPVSQLLPN